MKDLYEHMVFFKFNDGFTEAKGQELVEQLQAFKGVIPGIVALTTGINVTEEVDKAKSYSLGLRVTFEDKESLRNYGPHPAHRAFGKAIEGVIEDVIVVDYPIIE